MKMNKNILIVLIVSAIALIAICSLSVAKTQENEGKDHIINNTVSSTDTIPENEVHHLNKVHSKEVNIITSIENNPKTAKKGQNITYTFVVTNKGTKPIFNACRPGQNEDIGFGTLNPGETKKYKYTEYIMTDEEVKADFGSKAEISSPYPIGGGAVFFTDTKGKEHYVEFDVFTIDLI